jgi:hypothetical protein
MSFKVLGYCHFKQVDLGLFMDSSGLIAEITDRGGGKRNPALTLGAIAFTLQRGWGLISDVNTWSDGLFGSSDDIQLPTP